MEKKNRIADGNPRTPSLGISLIPIVAIFVLLYGSLRIFNLDVQIPLIFASIIAAFIAVVILKNKWDTIEKGIIDSIQNAMQAILIACFIGMIIGSWIAGGIVSSLIYYGLKILSPKFFLVTCLLVCSIVAVTAGAVVSAAYFGDKMSPFSDTTNLAPAVSGTTLFAHIRHMVYTAGTSYALAIIGYMVLNIRFTGEASSESDISAVLVSLKEQFVISPLLVLPLLLLILMICFKIPAIPGLVASMLLGVICALLVQGQGIEEIGTVLSYGYSCETGNKALDELLSKGGLQNMMWTVSLILCSLTFGGIMHSSGMLSCIANHILKVAKGTGGLITATGITAVFVNLVCGEQYLSILLTGRMYKDEYEKRDLAPQNLSRTLEDFGTMTSPLIPWTTCAVAMSTYLNVPTLDYLPYSFLNLVNPLVAIVFAFTGFTIRKRSQVAPEDI